MSLPRRTERSDQCPARIKPRAARRLPVAAACVALALGAARLLGACPGSAAGDASGAASASQTPGPQLTITPATGTRHARPEPGITVTAAGGKITKVTVRTGGRAR